MVLDLNEAPFGITVYAISANSLNIPNAYGLVITFGNEDDINTTRWRFQLACGTNGEMYLHNLINNGSWDKWKRIYFSI